MKAAKAGSVDELTCCNTVWQEIHALAQSVRKKRSDGFSFEKLLDVFLTTTQ
ncbi:hypothetical protein BDV98DRAFT_422291 [Pterulicium gracile]|uniref:Uncharacterized protein n=1 Tax=Pterulicium gracile TaxID=1884261 RepID=A0A5C3PZY7_9AGAR|nr:hypothetical protein BDV98DRAFT_422291 [Pterula gracilis]